MEMKEKLRDAAKLQEEKRIEEEKRSWANEGLAKLNEILRKQDDVAELSYQIISYLINYMNANQGGIFIRNNDDPNNITLELQSFYAFNRRKFIKKTFELGEGLVGNCAIEKKRVHITEIPDNYIQITSGLGGSNPKSLVLVPMKLEDEVLGVIEIASFNNFEDYQIDFLEQASLSIASSLNMAETNKRTSELLEKTQQQAEEMSAQEEEMRQNMEELQATQEESTRRNVEMEKLLEESQIQKEDMERIIEQSQKQAEEIEMQIVEFEEREIVWETKLESANEKIKELEAKLKKK
jgi:putative methionine-R-sulfoxide reductase with GAF domain